MAVVNPDVVLISSDDDDDGGIDFVMAAVNPEVVLISSDDDDDGERNLDEGRASEQEDDYIKTVDHEWDKDEEIDVEKSIEGECLANCDERRDRSGLFNKGDACRGDVVLFKQQLYNSQRIRIGRRTVAGRIVNESYGASSLHTFSVEVLWSKWGEKLHPLSILLVKGRNLYKFGTFRQPWKNEAERPKVLEEKHKRGKEARRKRKLMETEFGSGDNKGKKRQKVSHRVSSQSKDLTGHIKHKYANKNTTADNQIDLFQYTSLERSIQPTCHSDLNGSMCSDHHLQEASVPFSHDLPPCSFSGHNEQQGPNQDLSPPPDHQNHDSESPVQRLADEKAKLQFPESSFSINCTGDAREGDIVLFKTKKKRSVAGRIVKSCHCESRAKHRFVIEVLWTMPFVNNLSTLVVRCQNLYKFGTFRQHWKNEAMRSKMLEEKHWPVEPKQKMKKNIALNKNKGAKRQKGSHNVRSSSKQPAQNAKCKSPKRKGTRATPVKETKTGSRRKSVRLQEKKARVSKQHPNTNLSPNQNQNSNPISGNTSDLNLSLRLNPNQQTNPNPHLNQNPGSTDPNVNPNTNLILSTTLNPNPSPDLKSEKKKAKRKLLRLQKKIAKKSKQQTFQLHPNTNTNLSPSLSTNPNQNQTSNPTSNATLDPNVSLHLNPNQHQNQNPNSNDPNVNPNTNLILSTTLNPNPCPHLKNETKKAKRKLVRLQKKIAKKSKQQTFQLHPNTNLGSRLSTNPNLNTDSSPILSAASNPNPSPQLNPNQHTNPNAIQSQNPNSTDRNSSATSNPNLKQHTNPKALQSQNPNSTDQNLSATSNLKPSLHLNPNQHTNPKAHRSQNPKGSDPNRNLISSTTSNLKPRENPQRNPHLQNYMPVHQYQASSLPLPYNQPPVWFQPQPLGFAGYGGQWGPNYSLLGQPLGYYDYMAVLMLAGLCFQQQ